mgnify:CR=1 FL=1
MNADTMLFTIIAPKDGGIVIYESNEEIGSSVVFGGNLEEATKYFQGRASALQGNKNKAGPAVADIAGPKITVRRIQPVAASEKLNEIAPALDKIPA